MMLTLPELRDIAPEYCEMNDRLQELHTELEKRAPRVAELMALAHKNGSFASPPTFKAQQPDPHYVAPIDLAARELLGSHAPPLAPRARVQTDPVRDELATLSEEMETIKQAIDLLTTAPATGGRSPWHAALLEASRKYCAAVALLYSPIAARYARALVELGDAINAHSEFSHGIQSRGVVWAGLKPMLMVLPPPHLRSAILHQAVSWAVECGHLPAEAMPKEWLRPSPELRKAAESQHFDGYRT